LANVQFSQEIEEDTGIESVNQTIGIETVVEDGVSTAAKSCGSELGQR
jgi:hypothetical protein